MGRIKGVNANNKEAAKIAKYRFWRFLASALLPIISILILPNEPLLAQSRESSPKNHALSEQEAIELLKRAIQLDQQGIDEERIEAWTRLAEYSESKYGVDHLNTAKILDNLANSYESNGLYSKAESLYQRSLMIREKALGVDHPDTAASLNNIAELYREQGLFSKAEPLFQRSLAIREKALGPDHPDTAVGLNNLALLYSDQGLYSKAESLYQRSMAILEKALGPDHPDTAVGLNNLAGLYSDQGLYSKAEPLFQRSLAIREKTHGPDHPDTAVGLNNLALLYSDQGLYSKAEPLYQRSLAIHEKALGLNHPDTATSLNNLAGLYRNQGLYSKAVPLLQRSLSIKEKTHGPKHPDTALGLNNLALLYSDQGLYSKAGPLYQRSLDIFEKALGPNHPDTATSLSTLALLYHSQGLYSKAEPLLQRSLAINEKALGPDHPDTATSLNNLAHLYYNQGLYSKAEPTLRSSLSTMLRLIQREAPLLPQADRRTYVASFGNVHQIPFTWISQTKTSLELALFSRLNRHGLLEEIEKRQAQLVSLPGEPQQVAAELRDLNQQLSSLALKPEQRQAMKSRQQELEKQLYRLLPQLKPRIVKVEQVAAALPADAVLIEFQRYQAFDSKKPKDQRWGEARYLAMVLKPDESITVVDLGKADVLEQAIRSAVSTAQQEQTDAPERFARVSQLLLAPLQKATAGANTWFVSPDAELNRLPFAALPMPAGAGYLSEAVKLNLITTGRELLDLQKPRPSAKSSALVVANPAYNRSGGTRNAALVAQAQGTSSDARQRSSAMPDRLQWDPLPATAAEGESVKAITGGKLLLQQQATAEAVKRTTAPKLLHLASHAFYLPNQKEEQPGAASKPQLLASSQGVVQTRNLKGESALLRSGIALAGANQPNADPNDDGYLTALEVAQLDWEGTELVVISACESGLGDLQVGEGVYGLKRAIAVAGARSSLLTLWKVDDDATRLFMESFYQRLKQGEGKAAALAATQKEFRDSPELSAYSHPYYWAAFQLSGDGGPIEGL